MNDAVYLGTVAIKHPLDRDIAALEEQIQKINEERWRIQEQAAAAAANAVSQELKDHARSLGRRSLSAKMREKNLLQQRMGSLLKLRAERDSGGDPSYQGYAVKQALGLLLSSKPELEMDIRAIERCEDADRVLDGVLWALDADGDERDALGLDRITPTTIGERLGRLSVCRAEAVRALRALIAEENSLRQFLNPTVGDLLDMKEGTR